MSPGKVSGPSQGKPDAQSAVLLWYYTWDVTQGEVRLGLYSKERVNCWKSRDRIGICGAGPWAVRKWVNREVLGGDLKKGGRRGQRTWGAQCDWVIRLEEEQGRSTWSFLAQWETGNWERGETEMWPTHSKSGMSGTEKEGGLMERKKGCRYRWCWAALLPLGLASKVTSLTTLIILSSPA